MPEEPTISVREINFNKDGRFLSCLFEQVNDVPGIGFTPFTDPNFIVQFMEQNLLQKDRKDYQYLLELTNPDGEKERIGIATLSLSGNHSPMIGIALDQKFRGRRLGGHCIDTMVDAIFRTMTQIPCIYAAISPENAASINAFTERGFIQQHKRKGDDDLLLFRINRETWRDRIITKYQTPHLAPAAVL